MKTTTVTALLAIIFAIGAALIYTTTRPAPKPLTLAQACDGTSQTGHCAPMVGCIAGQEATFTGRTNGYFKGEIIGILSNGLLCSGEWAANPTNSGGTGTATCSDGTTFSVGFHKYDRSDWTLIGKGTTSLGKTVYAITSAPAFRKDHVPVTQIKMLEKCQRLLTDQ
ncbi:hypothetical protein F9L33_11035 [Amylibacter sp. SFDW26]|uniref:hypothetical protein n=1 Tax=Amylibacter sp. SFDW26 TaxID=2652722 RepID=UPI0012629998|nr:hypothetical protein [Amylibacter sp. SFDW26]KAB7613886.1 hypothetical protein F9L33_11035 [Amylibacter sp. SFDW26]